MAKRTLLKRSKSMNSAAGPQSRTENEITTTVSPIIDIRMGDITTTQVDVIVISSTSAWLRNKIFQAGGDQIEADYNLGAKEDSIVVVATNDKLPMKNIFFVPFINSPNEDQLTATLENLVRTAMENAFVRNFRSIAFPAIGCGLFGCPVATVAASMVKTAYQEFKKYKMSITFVIEPTKLNIYEEFQKQVALVIPPSLIQPAKIIASLNVENSSIEIVRGDLVTENVDVIVASSTSEILLNRLFCIAGDQTLQAYKSFVSDNPDSPLILVDAGKLPSRIIFIPKWKPNSDGDALQDSISNLIGFVIQNVIVYEYKSVAIPSIGCGNHGCSMDIVAKTMIEETKHQLKRRRSALQVKFVIEPDQKEMYRAFHTHLLTINELHLDYIRPSTWEPMKNDQIRFIVANNTTEYTRVLNEFDKTMKGTYQAIVRIERIQNERWYKQYLAHSQEFRNRLQSDTEMRLFHGCDETAAASIIKDCFNRSFAGKNGTAYGVGVYFSPNASHSHAYTRLNAAQERCMFYSRVLIGKTTRGNSAMKTVPVGFDSTTSGGDIYVTYHDAQAYAEYLITYK